MYAHLTRRLIILIENCLGFESWEDFFLFFDSNETRGTRSISGDAYAIYSPDSKRKRMFRFLSLSLSLFRYIIYIYRNTLHRTRNGDFFKEMLNSQCSKWKMCSNNFQDEKWERANFLLKQKSQTNLANRIFMISNATCFVVHHRSITHPLFRSASECRFQ